MKIKKINWNKIWSLMGLVLVHQLLITILLIIIGLFSWELYMFVYCVNMVILWKIYFKPVFKEIGF